MKASVTLEPKNQNLDKEIVFFFKQELFDYCFRFQRPKSKHEKKKRRKTDGFFLVVRDAKKKKTTKTLTIPMIFCNSRRHDIRNVVLTY